MVKHYHKYGAYITNCLCKWYHTTSMKKKKGSDHKKKEKKMKTVLEKRKSYKMETIEAYFVVN